ncbi:hydroxymethylglutaryl-CoA reductase, degradative [Candidatus Micrarchaeota archaeon]|nr:hydroxymethylglutaryl-CoA reductase, degradative [Candidatus Micrarchaeota archaeon]MBU1939879.1 hydroxymethylglutaryl-CoA reductase, degradative [Candidatus Micrarchaeota archaeon]
MRSDISGFYKKSRAERLAVLKDEAGISAEEISLLEKGGLDFETADRMVENAISVYGLPMGIATNFRVNGKDYLVPMVIEEPSVVAAASNAAKLARPSGGFKANASTPLMIGQVQLAGIKNENFAKAIDAIKQKEKELIALANSLDPVLVKHGGGAKELQLREVETARGKMLVVHLLVNCGDAMGANAVNSMAEKLAPEFEALSGGRARLKIISNYALHRTVKASAVWKKDDLGGEVIEAMLDANALAQNDVFRACTNNKGIMNGIDSVLLATGNDWRAVEAGAHAYASRNGTYKALQNFYITDSGDLAGELEMPLAVGLVGGATKTHALAKIAVKILGVKSANELAEVCCSLGLAQTFAANRAIVKEGIQRGHMGLHAKNVAVSAGAKGSEIDAVAQEMAKTGKISADNASKIIDNMRRKGAKKGGKGKGIKREGN